MTERPATLIERLRKSVVARRTFELVSQTAILVWLVSFSLETLPNLPREQRDFLEAIEWFTALLFTAEYVIRLIFAENRLKFVFSFFGIIDLLSILPFYFELIDGMTTLRALRLMRLARLLKIARYNRAVHRLYQAWMIAWEEFVMFFFVALILIYIAAAGIYHFEHEAQPDKFTSIFDSLWWAICTLTTVGYGDVYPITAGGRVFTCMVLLIGLGIVAVPTGLVASSLTQVRDQEKLPSPLPSEGNLPVD
jgi:voltage-gated potassium channel